jgi:hypothetical protein
MPLRHRLATSPFLINNALKKPKMPLRHRLATSPFLINNALKITAMTNLDLPLNIFNLGFL